MAPEIEKFFDCVEYLKRKDIIISLGHSNGNYELFKKH